MRRLIAIWGIFGITVLVGRALWRLAPIAWEPIADGSLTTIQWVIMIAWSLFNAYAEGYRGFHLRFSPRTVARAFYLVENPTPLRVILAPAFCMGLFGATRKVLITSWIVVIMVVLLVMLIRVLDQPWRGIIDAGVVVGLFGGLLSLLWIFLARLGGRPVDFDPAIPDTIPSPESE